MSNSGPPERDFAAYRNAIREAYSPTQRDHDRLRDSLLRSFADEVPRPDIDQLAAAANPRSFGRILRASYPFVKQAAALLVAAGIGGAIAVMQAPRFQRTPSPASTTQAGVDRPVPPGAGPNQAPRAFPSERVPTLPSTPVASVETQAGPPPAAAAGRHRRTLQTSRHVRLAGTSEAEQPPELADDLADSNISPPAEARATPAPETRSSLAEELRLIRAASQALDADLPAIALERLVEHSRRFPAGSLAIERSGLELIARCTIDPRAQLHGERELFLARFPTAPVAARVSRACENAR
jgi:hypothetical protein